LPTPPYHIVLCLFKPDALPPLTDPIFFSAWPLKSTAKPYYNFARVSSIILIVLIITRMFKWA
jgi:hypothetical protein